MAETTEVRTTADQIVMLERNALDRWGKGDPGGFLDVYGADVTYFDPLIATRIDGHQAMVDYYRLWVGKIHVARYEMLNSHVVVDGNMALPHIQLGELHHRWPRGRIGRDSMESTTVYQRCGDAWKTIHSHWSFMSHPAFQAMTAEATEGLNG